MSDFKPFDDKLTRLISMLSSARRRKLTAENAKELCKSQPQRIKQQIVPDDSPYEARKRQPLRGK
nr:phage virion morphogenesis protein [Pseudescherichia sp.]